MRFNATITQHFSRMTQTGNEIKYESVLRRYPADNEMFSFRTFMAFNLNCFWEKVEILFIYRKTISHSCVKVHAQIHLHIIQC